MHPNLIVLVFFIYFLPVVNLDAQSCATNFEEMKGTLFTHSITDKTDSLSAQEIIELRDEKGLPLWFSRDIFKNVCLTGQCRLVRLRIYWDGAANYLGVQLHENELLTKTDHKKFKPEDYEKLDRILSNPLSVLKVLKIEDLTVETEEEKKAKVDGHSGATQPSLSEYIVKDAVYTCYTLWHTVYGTTREKIRSILEQRADVSYLRLLFDQKYPQYLSWAIDYIGKHREYHQAFYHEIMNQINSEDASLSKKALHYFIPVRLSDTGIQKELAFVMGEASAQSKFEIILIFSALPKVNNDVILILLEQFENKKINAGLLELVCKLIRPENLKDIRIVKKLKNISNNKSLYVRNMAQKLLSGIKNYSMITFILSIVALLLGYIIYGRFIERVFKADSSRQTPAQTMADGVDYIPMPWWRIFLIQFLNIAGLGPIFGAVAGAMWGPVAFLWIVLGSIFAGAVHDYFSGMLSVRHNGLSITEIVGIYLGNGTKQFMRVFTVILMILVGAVFIMGPAKILAGLTPNFASMTFWVWVIFIYYILATLLPIDKLIGKIYPVFGFALFFMAFGLITALFVKGYQIPELSLDNLKNFHVEAENYPIFPMLFITIACGAISGFHATQSPMMARCITNEELGRRVFYGAMITEGVVALIWAAIGMSFYGGVRELNDVMTANHGNAAFIVNEISNSLLGKFGGALALLGVVVAPITSGDTAFRGARLIVADFLNLKQGPIRNRLMISVPLFTVGFLLTRVDFSIIWRYFAWSNQTLSMVVLWTITVYLTQERKQYWVTLVPAVFMTAVTTTYLLFAPEGFSLSMGVSYSIGIVISMVALAAFLKYRKSILRI